MAKTKKKKRTDREWLEECAELLAKAMEIPTHAYADPYYGADENGYFETPDQCSHCYQVGWVVEHDKDCLVHRAEKFISKYRYEYNK